MTVLAKVRVVAMSTALGIGILTLSGCEVPQEASPTPDAGADIFDPAVAEATPIPGVETFEVESASHTTDPVDYPQDPPAGGPHDPSWQKCAVYDAPVRHENAVHSMEHGAVWITYRPDLPKDQVAKIRNLADQSYVLASPYPGLPAPVVASAWGKQLKLDSANDPRLKQFVSTYRQGPQTPEPGAPCTGGVGSPE